MKKCAALAAFLFVAAVVPRASGQAPAEVPRIETVPGVIQQILDDYGRSFVEKDERLLGSLSTGGLRAELVDSLRNARAIPFTRFVVRATTQFSGNLASPRIKRRYAAKDVRTYHVIEDTRLDVEAESYMDEGAFTFVRDRSAPAQGYDGWRLAATDDLAILGFFSPYHLWDEGRVEIARSAHFLLLAHPDTIGSVRPLLDVLERSYAHDQKTWPLPITKKYAVIIPSTNDELGRIIHETVDLSKFVAFTSAGTDPERGFVSTHPRFFVQLSHIKNYPKSSQEEIFAHELIHAVTRPYAGPHVPSWVEEGLANALGGNGGRSSLAFRKPIPDDFPSDSDFVTGSVTDIETAYDRGQVAIETLRDRFGAQGLARFYEALGERRIVAGTDDYQVRVAVSKAVEWSVDDWIAAWRKRLGA